MGRLDAARVFAYVIDTVGVGYRLNGCVPESVMGRIFFGPCKQKMRPEVKRGDYIMGISPARAGDARRVLLWMRVAEAMSFAEAYERGERDPIFLAARGKTIHVRAVNRGEHVRGNPSTYEHIPGAAHATKWRRDIEGKKDVMFLGDKNSWIAEKNGPRVTEELVALLDPGIWWKGLATEVNPLTEYARGRHIRLEGTDAQRVVRWMSRRFPERANLRGRQQPINGSPEPRKRGAYECGVKASDVSPQGGAKCHG